MKGNIRQRSDGSWEIRYDGPRHPDGRRNQKSVTFRGTKREAERELTRLVNEVNTGNFIEPTRMKVSEYLNYWLENYAKTNVCPKTYEGYAEFVRVHLSPAFGHHPLTKLQPLHIQAYYSQALRTGRKDGKGGLSARTVLHHHRVLHKALQQAVKWQLLARNPSDAVEPPRPAHKEMKVLDQEGMSRLLDAARQTRLYVPILLAIGTGMRRGEILALRWQDVDVKLGQLQVCQSLQQTKDGLAFKQPKTAKSRRKVALPSSLVDELVRHRGEQEQEKALVGDGYQDLGLVAAQPDGQPHSPNAISQAFGHLIRRTDLPDIGFHGLRHSHATHLLLHNIHAKVVSERLGHSNIGITLDTYSHVLPGMQEEAARRVDEVFRRGFDGT